MAGRIECNGCIHAPHRFAADTWECGYCEAWLERHEAQRIQREHTREVRRRRRELLQTSLAAAVLVAVGFAPIVR